MIDLRPYQSDAINALRTSLREHRAVLLVSPTGSGKTVMFSYMAHSAAGKGLRVVVLAHREELLDQISGTLARFRVPHGFIAAGRPMEPGYAVQVASVGTLVRRLDRVRAPDLVIVDEAHHCIAASQWGKVLAAWPGAKVVGVTATPCRLSGEGLGEVFQSMVMGPTVRQLIDLGALCRYRLFAPPSADLSQVHTRMGDYVKGELAEAMDKSTVTGDAVKHYARLADGKRAVAFCVSVEHAEHVAEQFRQAGHQAARIDGSMEREERRGLVRRFGAGEVKVLTSCDLISEGFDLPSIEAAILLRPTQSLSLCLQQVGRALRPFPGKEYAIILDHAGNVRRHGLPDDDREWSLEGNAGEKRGSASEVAVAICKLCFAAIPSGSAFCPHCNAAVPKKPREIEHRDGELQEIDLDQQRLVAKLAAQQRAKEQGKAQSLDDLIALGKARNYRDPIKWASYIFTARAAKQQRRIAP